MLARILIAFVRLYQRTLSILLRGAFGPVCRFEPSCSRYAVACLEGHGALRGSLLSFKRLCRCSPFHPGGFDPPPPPDPRRAVRLRNAHDIAMGRRSLPIGLMGQHSLPIDLSQPAVALEANAGPESSTGSASPTGGLAERPSTPESAAAASTTP